LKDYLEKNGHKVVYNLEDDDIDIILLTEPRKTSESSMFTHIDVLKYIQFVKNDVAVIHRINECDERKNTNFVNQYLIEANKSADATVFVSSWLRNLFIKQGLECENISVIMSGANSKVFYSSDQNKNIDYKKLNIVTHHWGGNWNKGFDIYKKLDELLDIKEYIDRFTFTYIGNMPPKFKFKNTNVMKPLSGKELADEIRKNDIYITGSLNEPSGNHHIEAAQCGLPLLYIDSGGIPEYCKDFGVMFNELNFENKLNEIYDNYLKYKDDILSYPYNSDLMSAEYLKLFNKLVDQKNRFIKIRKQQNLISNFEKYFYIISRKLKKYIKNKRNI
jgi:glycosyltransferase involved in cell wall biosynthesis